MPVYAFAETEDQRIGRPIPTIYDTGEPKKGEICNEYIKIYDQVLKLPVSATSHYHDKSASNKCASSKENPHPATSFSFDTSVEVPGHPEELAIHVSVASRGNPKKFSKRPEIPFVALIKESLKTNGKAVSDLPREGEFYKFDTYIMGSTTRSTIYICKSSDEGFLWRTNNDCIRSS